MLCLAFGVSLAVAVRVLLGMATFVTSLPDQCSEEQRRELADPEACETY